jgi:hypothetical protein
MAITVRGGQSIDINGRPLMVRDSRLASQNFGLGGSSFTAVPKSKFMFYVRFHRTSTNGASNWEQTLSFAVKSLDRPKIEFDTETINQYNKKRIVQTRVNYSPVNLRLHDTIDNRAQAMFQEYFQFYYGDGKNTNDEDWFYDITLDEFKNSGSWGFIPPSGEPNQTYFFSKVQVYQIYSGRYDQFDLIHPKISSFDPDDLDYANGDTPNEIQMTLEYEGIIQKALGEELTDELVKEMGLDVSGFYEAGDRPILPPGILKNLPAGAQNRLSGLIGGNSSTNGILNPLTRLIGTAQSPLNVLTNNIPGLNDISFGNSLQSNTLGRLVFGSNNQTGNLTTSATPATTVAGNTGRRNGVLESISNSALRGLNALRGR